MALSGSVSTNKYTTTNHGTIGLILSWTASQSIANNQTTINWTLKSNGTMSSGYYVQAGPVTVKIAGTTVLNTTSRFNMHGSGGYSRSGTIKVTHNQDGTKSISMSVRAAIYSASVNCTGSKTFSLNKITRYALLDTYPNFDDEGNPTITYINPAGSELVNNLKIRLTWNDGADYTSWAALSPDGGSYTFDLDSYRTQLRTAAANAPLLKVTYDLQSELGGDEYHDEKGAVMNIVNANPTPGTLSYADVNPTTSGITGDNSIVVQSQSTLEISTTAATPKKEATIASYSINFNGTDYTPDGSGNVDIVKPNYSGTFTATLTVTDSRGFKGTSTLSIPITAWAQPTAECTIGRVNGFETNTTLTVDGNISTVTGSSMSITEEHSDDNGSTWSAAASVTDNTPTTIALLNTKEWLVRVKIWDSFTSGSPTSYVLSVGKGIPILFIDTDMGSVGVNGFPDANSQLFVGGTAKLKPNDTDAGITLPHNYDTNEQIVGYWTDGTPVYELTIEFSENKTINGDSSFTVPTANWNLRAMPVDIVLYRMGDIANQTQVCFRQVFATVNNSGQMQIWSARDIALTFNIFTVRYIKLI